MQTITATTKKKQAKLVTLMHPRNVVGKKNPYMEVSILFI